MDTNKETGLPNNLASIAPADMLNVWNATKLSNKSGTVNTADGKQFLFPNKHWIVGLVDVIKLRMMIDEICRISISSQVAR